MEILHPGLTRDSYPQWLELSAGRLTAILTLQLTFLLLHLSLLAARDRAAFLPLTLVAQPLP